MGTPLRAPKSILVTGGCGFIGSAFIRWLFRSRAPELAGRVLNLDLLTYAANPENVAEHAADPRYTFAQGDIRDQALVARLCDEHAVDTIIHFAAESHADRSILGPLVFVETNVLGTARLLEVVRARPGTHFHHVSTDEVYGSLGPTGYFTEDSPYRPSSPYAASKAASDHVVRAYAHTYGISATISNCSNNYGPYQFPEKLIPLMIVHMLERRPLPIYGDGLHVRDWLHVDDHAEAIWAIVTRGASGRTYSIGGRSERPNLDLIRLLIAEVARQTGAAEGELSALMRFVADRPGHDRRYAIDCSRIERELGWAPRHDLGRGLAATVRWYLDNPRWIERVRSGEYRRWIEANYGAR